MIKLIEKYYPRAGITYPILARHSRQVSNKAVTIARKLADRYPVDLGFIEEAALLHDIGILFTHTPEIGCHGDKPYIMHGVLGRELLEQEGLPRHALVCERHIGVGLSCEDVIEQSLPLPQRDMLPVSLEEQIITYADLFFSKSPHAGEGERTYESVRQRMLRHGQEKINQLDQWHKFFSHKNDQSPDFC